MSAKEEQHPRAENTQQPCGTATRIPHHLSLGKEPHRVPAPTQVRDAHENLTDNAPFTIEEVLALPVTVDLMTTARALGISKTVAYHLARTGQYPVPLYKVGTRYRCLRSVLLAHLGIADPIAPYQPSPLSAVAR
jgi:hypothetical protein